MRRVLVLCTHNSARSQMAEGWIRHLAHERGVGLQVASAGTERTFVKPDAVTVMAEIGVDLTTHASKRLDELDDPWAFDLVVTVCDTAAESCPAYPSRTRRAHVPLPDPSGRSLAEWRRVRDAVGAMSEALVELVAADAWPEEAALVAAAESVLAASRPDTPPETA